MFFRRCGKATDEVWEASQYEFSNKMIVIFDNTGGMEDQPKSRGFKMKFESMGTGQFLTSNEIKKQFVDKYYDIINKLHLHECSLVDYHTKIK